ncbi:glycine receptor subunit alpha-2-like [Glandiceps talaboti]
MPEDNRNVMECYGVFVRTEQNRTDLQGDEIKEGHKDLIHVINNNLDIGALRPDDEGPPVNVSVGIYINSVDSIQAEDMGYSISMHLKMNWFDSRLVHNSTKLILNTPNFIDRVWKPDIYFDDERKGQYHTVITDNRALSILPNGRINYRLRLSMTLSCYMKLINFPMDEHTCSLTMLSFAHNSDSMLLKWRDPPLDLNYNKKITLPQFVLDSITKSSVVADIDELKKRAQLTVSFKIHRQMGYYVLTAYIPTILLVILSWVSFWLRPEATAARVSLGITTILTATTRVSDTRNSIPAVSYPTAMDVWTTSCIVFIFSAMLEFAFVNYYHLIKKTRDRDEERERKNKKRKKKVKNIPTVANGSVDFASEETDWVKRWYIARAKAHPVRNRFHWAAETARTKETKTEETKGASKARRIDEMSRILFPVMFIIFNIIYWCIYAVFWNHVRHFLSEW